MTHKTFFCSLELKTLSPFLEDLLASPATAPGPKDCLHGSNTGTTRATELIATGDLVEVDGGTGRVRVLKRRAPSPRASR